MPEMKDGKMGKIGTMSQSNPVTAHGIFNTSVQQIKDNEYNAAIKGFEAGVSETELDKLVNNLLTALDNKLVTVEDVNTQLDLLSKATSSIPTGSISEGSNIRYDADLWEDVQNAKKQADENSTEVDQYTVELLEELKEDITALNAAITLLNTNVKTAKITFNTKCSAVIDSQNVVLGESIALPSGIIEDMETAKGSGYKFGGWLLNGEEFDVAQVIKDETPIELEAKWTVQVIFNPDPGAFDSSTMVDSDGNYVLYVEEGGVILEADVPKTSNATAGESWTLLGWYYTSTDNSNTKEKLILNSTIVSKPIRLTAEWANNDYSAAKDKYNAMSVPNNDSNTYTNASYDKVTEAKKNCDEYVDNVNNNETTGEAAELYGYIHALEKAISELVLIEDAWSLIDRITEAASVAEYVKTNSSSYEATSYDVVNTAYSDEVVTEFAKYKDETTDTFEANKVESKVAYNTLNTLVTKLESSLKNLMTDKLKSARDEYAKHEVTVAGMNGDDYTTSSWNALKAEYESAKKLYDNWNIIEATDTLTNFVKNIDTKATALQEQVDKFEDRIAVVITKTQESKYRALYSTYTAKTASNYTEESWNYTKSIHTSADMVFNQNNIQRDEDGKIITPAELLVRFEAALNGLVSTYDLDKELERFNTLSAVYSEMLASETNYDTDSEAWTEMKDAYGQASNTYNTHTDEDPLDAPELKALQEDLLTLEDAMITLLSERFSVLKGKAPSKEQSGAYTSESYSNMDKAKEEARSAVLTPTGAKDLKDKIDAFETTIADLVKLADLEAAKNRFLNLQTVKNDIENNLVQYVSSKDAMVAQYEDAKRIYDSGLKENTLILAKKELQDLNTSLEGLESEIKTLLKEIYAELSEIVEEKMGASVPYTPSSMKELNEKYEAAKLVFKSSLATETEDDMAESEVTKQYNVLFELKTALDNLVTVELDNARKEYDQLIGVLPKIDVPEEEALYTSKSWEPYKAAYIAAQTARNSAAADELNIKLDELEVAYAGLVRKSEVIELITNYNALMNVIDTNREQYTEADLKSLEPLISNAETEFNGMNAEDSAKIDLVDGAKRDALKKVYTELNDAYAELNPQSFTVTFKLTENGDVYHTETVDHSQSVVEPKAPTRMDSNNVPYTFIEWRLKGKAYSFNEKVTQNIELIAKWGVNVTLNANNGEDASLPHGTILEGEKISDLPTPEYKDHVFMGWYQDKVKFSLAKPVTENITLTAKWITQEQFNKLDGIGVPGYSADNNTLTQNTAYTDESWKVMETAFQEVQLGVAEEVDNLDDLIAALKDAKEALVLDRDVTTVTGDFVTLEADYKNKITMTDVYSPSCIEELTTTAYNPAAKAVSPYVPEGAHERVKTKSFYETMKKLVDELREAINNLASLDMPEVRKEFEALKETLPKVSDKNQYTEASWTQSQYEEKYNAAQEAAKGDKADTLKEAMAELVEASKELVAVKEVQDVIKDYNKLLSDNNQNLYTEKSWFDTEEKREAAKDVFGELKADDFEAINKIDREKYNALKEAYDNLAEAFNGTLVKKQFKVTFKSDGAQFGEVKTVEINVRIQAPSPAPVKTGYTLKGWCVEGTDILYVFDTPVTKDLVLTAKWEITSVQATQDTFAKVEDKWESLQQNKGDYTDNSWKAVEEAYAAAKAEANKGDKANADTLNGLTDKLDTAISNLKKKVFTVTFMSDGVPCGTAQAVTVKEKVAEPTPAPTKAGYIFKGWFVGETPYNFEAPVTANLTLTAQWEITSLKAAQDAFAKVEDLYEELRKNKGDYTEDSWNAVEDAYNAAKAEANKGDKANADTLNNLAGRLETAIGNLVKKTYTVTFMSDGEQYGDVQTINSGEKVIAPAAPEKAGYKLTGWYAEEATEAYNFETPVRANLVLTAKWSFESLQAAKDAFKKYEDMMNSLKKEDYTEESWKAFEDAYKAVQEELAKGEEADLGKLADLFTKLEEAANGLVKNEVNLDESKKVALKEVVDAFKNLEGLLSNLNQEDYTEESWKVLEDAYNAARAEVAKGEDADPDKLKELVTAFEFAIAGLVKKDVAKVQSIKITGISKKIAMGKKVKLTATVSPETVANKAVTWTSSNKKFATVNSKGVVKTKKKGKGKKVTITATAADGSGVVAKYKIKIMPIAVKQVKITTKTTTVKAGEKLSLTADVTPKASKKEINAKLLWTSSNTKYATVTQKGLVKTKKSAKNKTVKITAKATDGSNKKAVFKIKITK